MKKAFSLIEILVSILIFSLIILALYKVLEIAKVSINTTSDEINNIKYLNNIKKIIFEDFIEAESIVLKELNNSQWVSLKTSNTYHNSLFTNISYLLDSENNLLRIESFKQITKENFEQLDKKNIYVDLILKDIKTFNVFQGENKNYLIFLKTITKEEYVLTIPYTQAL